jgi:hypothetical protein
MAIRDRRRREDDAPGTEREPDAVAAATPAASVLRLQRLAGNHAVAGLIARAPATTTAPVLAVAGYGTYAVKGFHPEGATSLKVGFDPGKDGARLLHASSSGERIPTVTITAGPTTITLTEVLIASFSSTGDDSTGEALATVEFNGETREIG